MLGLAGPSSPDLNGRTHVSEADRHLFMDEDDDDSDDNGDNTDEDEDDDDDGGDVDLDQLEASLTAQTQL